VRRAACASSLFQRVAARQASSSAAAGALRHGWERYSTEVQQLTRTLADLRGRGRTVTCRDGRGWTRCRQMACKRSALRARLAPPRSEAKFEQIEQVVQQESTATAAVWAAVCVFGSGIFSRLGPPAGHRIPGAESTLASLSPGQIQSSPSRDSRRLVITRLSWRAIPARLLPHLQVVQPRWPSWRSGPLPGAAPTGRGRAFADGRRGARARRVAPMVSVRRWARVVALRRRVAPWRSLARLSAGWCAR
jgi:hypothetical protein